MASHGLNRKQIMTGILFLHHQVERHLKPIDQHILDLTYHGPRATHVSSRYGLDEILPGTSVAQGFIHWAHRPDPAREAKVCAYIFINW